MATVGASILPVLPEQALQQQRSNWLLYTMCD
jgi:hypothetical protein